MPAPLDRSPLLGESYELGEDFRVRLRMARSSDLLPIRALLASKHREPEAEVTALVQFDPRRRCVICASALIDSTETLIGVGLIELDGDDAAMPRVLIVDPRYPRVAELLTHALIARARQAARARAA